MTVVAASAPIGGRHDGVSGRPSNTLFRHRGDRPLFSPLYIVLLESFLSLTRPRPCPIVERISCIEYCSEEITINNVKSCVVCSVFEPQVERTRILGAGRIIRAIRTSAQQHEDGTIRSVLWHIMG